MKKTRLISCLCLLTAFYINAQTVVETISSGTSGDAILKIEADTDNNNENDNPLIKFTQDEGLTNGFIGLTGDANSFFTNSGTNSLFVKSPGSFDFQIATNNEAQLTVTNDGYVGIGTNNPNEKLHVNGTTTITADIGVPNDSYWKTGAHTFELQNSDAGDVIMSFHRGGHSSASIKHSSLGGLIFSGLGTLDANHMFLKGNGNLGIGTVNPLGKLEIQGKSGEQQQGQIHLVGNGGMGPGDAYISFAEGAETNSKWSVGVKDNGNAFSISHGLTMDANPKLVITDATGNVGIGTTLPDSKLTVAGNIHAQEVKVTINAGADFVFEEAYKLPSLKSVETFIKKNKHLPEIASEKDMKANGLLLAEMNIKLLQKIEELTLYTIEQGKQIKAQELTNEELKARLIKLEELLLK